MKDYILKDFADKRIFNYLYSTEKGFFGYMDKLTKKERALIGAKLIWKRKENKYTADEFAIEFLIWASQFGLQRFDSDRWQVLGLEDFGFGKTVSTKEILEQFKKEKGL
jgi:hypothetical protein